MFQRLQKKWKVNGLQVILILCTFAIGGSLTGYVGKRIMNLVPLEKGAAWIIIYILLVTLIWPFSVLMVSVFFGQFRFFVNYLKKIGSRMGLGGRRPGNLPEVKQEIHRVAIFASGAGSNAQQLINHFRNNAGVTISLIVCNKPGAGVLGIAAREDIPVLLIDRDRFFKGDGYLPDLHARQIDFIVLAGFLWKLPIALIQQYQGKIVNIHPALLPKYGGKGMYGQHVHQAVIAAGEKESGITIHYVDEIYDHGASILQVKCPVLPGDTSDTLAKRIHELEHQHYPKAVEKLLSGE